MQTQLSELGLPFERIDAVDGFDGSEIGYPAQHKRLSKGEFACYLSHVKTWKRFLDSGEPRCLILEDDVVLSRSLPQILAHKPFFDHSAPITRLECRIFRTKVAKWTRHSFNGIKLRKLTAYDGGTGANVYSREYLNHLYTNFAEPQIPVDDRVLDPSQAIFPSFAVFQLDPAPATQSIYVGAFLNHGSRVSDLDSTRVEPDHRLPSSNPLATFVREFKELVRNIRNNLFHTFKVIPFKDD